MCCNFKSLFLPSFSQLPKQSLMVMQISASNLKRFSNLLPFPLKNCSSPRLWRHKNECNDFPIYFDQQINLWEETGSTWKTSSLVIIHMEWRPQTRICIRSAYNKSISECLSTNNRHIQRYPPVYLYILKDDPLPSSLTPPSPDPLKKQTITIWRRFISSTKVQIHTLTRLSLVT